MRFDAAKAYPHPVLRPGSSDYPKVEFQVEIKVDRPQDRTAVKVGATFSLSEPTLMRLVDEGKARYILRVLASKTHYRSAFASRESRIERVFDEGCLHGRIELSPFLVCVSRLRGFTAPGWHSDYSGQAFDIAPGSVLAEDRPEEYWIDTAEETPVGSIFNVSRTGDSGLHPGMWKCRLDSETVMLEISAADYETFVAARNRVANGPEAAYLLNAIYLPALIWVLEEADRNEDLFGEFRWYRALGASLERDGLPPLGKKGKLDRLVDAQKLFQRPFGRMPLLANAQEPLEMS